MKSFLTGRPIASVNPLKSISSPHTSAGSSSSALPQSPSSAAREHDHAGAHVECVKQGDKVVRLIVTCGCGERIEIDCVYPAGG